MHKLGVYLTAKIIDMIYVTRKEHFNAAHKVWRAEWSEEKNYEIFW